MLYKQFHFYMQAWLNKKVKIYNDVTHDCHRAYKVYVAKSVSDDNFEAHR